ncbi:MAG: hypothetical protein NVS3B14_17230 [Ktedonobacteraceae bacterium]
MQADMAQYRRPVNTPLPDLFVQKNVHLAEQSTNVELAVPRQPVQPTVTSIAGRQQPVYDVGMQQAPMPSLHEIQTNHLQLSNGNGNGNSASSMVNGQDWPILSSESFASTGKAAERWRNSWRDRQYAEAGPVEDVSKGQASVPSPLADRQNSFTRMRAFRTRQGQERSERNFAFWVTIFLMICLIGGLGAYIIYTYLPNASTGDASISQPAGSQQPSLAVEGTSSLAFSNGQSLQVHGEHFRANDTLHFSLDTSTPIVDSGGKALTAQADEQGAFDVTIVIGKNWPAGTDVIQAIDTSATLSGYLVIEVNPAGSPLTSSPDLSITLNGQPARLLSFAGQTGQQAPPTQYIVITNTSDAALRWTAAARTNHNLNWLTIVDEDFSGQLNIQEPHKMGIRVNPAALFANSNPYTGQILFTINGNQQLTLPVQLTIVDATPEIVFSPDPITAMAKTDGTCQSDATLTLINLGKVSSSWSVIPGQNNILFIDGTGKVTEEGVLQPSGMAGDTQVVTLHCSGVKAGDKINVSIYEGPIEYSDFVVIQ